MFGSSKQRALGQPTEFFEIKQQIILPTSGVFERIAETQEWRRRWGVYSSIYTEGEMGGSSCKRNPRFLESSSSAAPIPGQCIACP